MTPQLLRQLRNPRDPDLRLKAVQTLGEMGRIDDAALLIRSAVEDPDGAVRSAAREALLDLIGAETDLAIATYRSEPDDEPWLVELAEEGDEDVGEELSFEDDQYLSGVVSVLRNHPDVQMRLKAIAELGRSSDLRVIAALAETVLWTDEDEVREAARQSLEARFGEDTQHIIQTYQIEGDWEDEDEEDLEEWAEDDEAASQDDEQEEAGEPWRAPVVGSSSAPQVVKTEGFPWLLAVIVGLGLVVMVALVLILLG